MRAPAPTPATYCTRSHPNAEAARGAARAYGRSSYDTYLGSAAWHVLRGQALTRDGRKCRACDSPDDLEVHHRRYPPFGRWDLDGLDALTTLCGKCHDLLTSELRARRYAAQGGLVLRDVVRLTTIVEPGDAHGRLPSFDVPDHRRLTPALPQWTVGRPAQPAREGDGGNFDEAEKTEADLRQLADLEFLGSLYLSNGAPCIPAEMMEAALARAAAQERRGAKAKAGLVIRDDLVLHYDGPTDPRALCADPEFRLRCGVRIGVARVMRTRPRFANWAADLVVDYLPALLNASDIRSFVATAGEQIGVGDWRPRFGRFSIEDTVATGSGSAG